MVTRGQDDDTSASVTPHQARHEVGVLARPGSRMVWMDTLRALAVVLVIVEHATILLGSIVPNYAWALGAAFRPFRIPALMFLSGMLLQRSLAKPVGQYVRGKVTRILWPYLVWTTILIVVSTRFGQREESWLDAYLAPTSPMFYLQYLVVFYAVALVLPERIRAWLIVPVLVASFFGLERWLFLFAFFLLGDVFARHADRFLRWLSNRWVIAASSVAAGALAVMALAGVDIRYHPSFAVGTAAGVLAAIALCRWLAETRAGRLIAPFGRHTIIFYVVSWPVQIITLEVLLDAGVTQPLLLVVLLFLAGLAAGLLITLAQAHVWPIRYLFDLAPSHRTGPLRGRAAPVTTT